MSNRVGDAREAEIDCCVKTENLLCAVVVGRYLFCAVESGRR